MNRLNKTESAVFKLWMLYFQRISFQISLSCLWIQLVIDWPSYLQCTNMGPSGTPSTSLTLSLKCNRAPALSGTPLSGQAVKWKCLKSFCSLVRFWKNIIMKTYDICLISMHRQISKILFWACRLKRAKTLYICSKVILTNSHKNIQSIFYNVKALSSGNLKY